MRVFELLTALCLYSQDGYELVLQALQDFQVNIIDFHLKKICSSFADTSSLALKYHFSFLGTTEILQHLRGYS